MKKALYPILTCFLILQSCSCTYAMELEKQQPVKQNNFVLGVPTLFDRIPRELRAILARLIMENNPEVAKYCWQNTEKVDLQAVEGPFSQIVNLDGDHVLIKTNNSKEMPGIWRVRDGSHCITLNVARMQSKFFHMWCRSIKGTKVATAEPDKIIVVWDTFTGVPTPLLDSQRNDCAIGACSFSEQGDKFASYLRDSAPKVWNTEDGSVLATLKGHRDRGTTLQFDPAGKTLLTVCNEDDYTAVTARIWDLTTGLCRATLGNQDDPVYSAQFNRQGTHIVTNHQKSAKVWSAQTGLCLTVIAVNPASIYFIKFSPAGNQIDIGLCEDEFDPWKTVWNMDGTFLDLSEARKTNRYLEFSPNGDKLAVPYPDNSVKILNPHNGECSIVLRGHAKSVNKIVWGIRGTIVTCSLDNTIRFWNSSTGTCNAIAPFVDKLESIKFSPLGNQIIAVFHKLKQNKCLLKIWDTTGYCVAEHELPGVRSKRFCPGGRHKFDEFWDDAVQFNPDGTVLFTDGVSSDNDKVQYLQILRRKDLSFPECVERQS